MHVYYSWCTHILVHKTCYCITILHSLYALVYHKSIVIYCCVVLDLSLNEIHSLDWLVNNKFPMLHTLMLAENFIMSLPPALFSRCASLADVDLELNVIFDIHLEAFHGADSIV